jgi:hypothetical protein
MVALELKPSATALSRYRQVASAIFFAAMTKMPTNYQL